MQEAHSCKHSGRSNAAGCTREGEQERGSILAKKQNMKEQDDGREKRQEGTARAYPVLMKFAQLLALLPFLARRGEAPW